MLKSALTRLAGAITSFYEGLMNVLFPTAIEPFLRYGILFAGISVVSFLSWYQGLYHIDPHHWGLMLSNAQDIAAGRLPYKEIFLQYGILTPLIQGLFFIVFGGTLQSVFWATICAYVIGLVGMYYLTYVLTSSRKLALYVFVSCVLLHPIVIYPWSNYIAFPFLVYGLFFYLKGQDTPKYFFISGLFLSLAVLCREGLFASVLIFSIVGTCLHLWLKDRFVSNFSPFKFWFGLLLPIAIFFAYLASFKLITYWHIDSVLLPQLYAQYFFKEGILGAIIKLKNFFQYLLSIGDERIVLVSLSLIATSSTCIAVLLGVGWLKRRWDCFMLGLFSLLLMSSTLHIPEMFRMATGMIVGIPLLYLIADRFKVSTLLFVGFSFSTAWTITSNPYNNNWFPTADQKKAAIRIDYPAIFIGQRWPSITYDYYKSVQEDLDYLHKNNCGIKFYVNDTEDAFLASINPFEPYQMAPYGRGLGGSSLELLEKLRPEFNLQKKLLLEKDTVFLTFAESKSPARFDLPAGYYLYSIYQVPSALFIPGGNFLLILAPDACTTRVDQ